MNALYDLSNQLSTKVIVDKSILENNIDTFINDGKHQILVAENNTSVVGYLSAYYHTAIYANGKVAYIDEIVVAKQHRGKRIGTQLLQEFERLAKSRNCVLISLASGGAKTFYEKMGYFSKAAYFKKYLK